MIKRSIKIFIVICISIGLFACQSTKTDTTVLYPESIQTIQYEELCTYLDDQYTFLLYIGRDDCSDCQQFKPYLEEYLKVHENTGVYYLNIKSFRDAAKKKNATEKEKSFFKNLYKELDFDWTPTIEVICNGEIIDKYQYLSEDYYNIKDDIKREEEKQKYLDQFESFMNAYYKKY